MSKAVDRALAASSRGRLWIENQDPASATGATIGWVRRYQAADGQLFAVLLAAYFFLTVIPLLLVETTYIYNDPEALADRMEHRLRLTGTTADLFHTVMAGSSGHKLSAALIAVVNLFFFGLGFGAFFRSRTRARGRSTCGRVSSSTRPATSGARAASGS